MLFNLLADVIVVFHLLFIVFAVLGAGLCFRWRKVVYVHVPVALWAAVIEFRSGLCPLTPLENWLRARSGLACYAGGFVENYILPTVYPDGLTREIQVALGGIVIAVNLLVYWWVYRRHKPD